MLSEAEVLRIVHAAMPNRGTLMDDTSGWRAHAVRPYMVFLY